MQKKLEVGQTVYEKYMNGNLTESSIIKVGRKWLLTSGGREYDLTTLKQKPTGFGIGYSHTLYLSREDYETEVQENKDRNSLSRILREGDPYRLPIEKVRAILTILQS